MRFAFYVAILVALVPLIFARPFFGLCVYYVVSLLQPKVLCWRPEFQDALYVGAPLVVGAILFGVHRRVREARRSPLTGRPTGLRERFIRSPLFEPSLLLVLFGLLIAYIGVNRHITLFPAELTAPHYSRLCKIGLVTLLLTGLAGDLRRFRILYAVVALSVAFWAIKGGLYVVALGPHQVYGRDYDNNLFALNTVMVLPMVFYFGLSLQHSRWRWCFLVFSALMCLAVIGSRSRAGFLAMAVLLVCFAWTSRHRFKSLAGVALLGVVALATSGAEIQARIESIRSFRKDPSASSRFVTWQTAMTLLKQHPLAGVGFMNFERASDQINGSRKAAHNIWLASLAELGMLGYPLWAGLIIGGVASAYQLMRFGRRCPPEMRWCYYWARGLFLGLVAFCIHGNFHNEEYLELMFTMLGMLVALRALARREWRGQALSRMAALPDIPPWPSLGRAFPSLSPSPLGAA